MRGAREGREIYIHMYGYAIQAGYTRRRRGGENGMDVFLIYLKWKWFLGLIS